MNSIRDFYDGFIEYQINSGINDRIYSLYRRLLKSGLKSSSNILEIGCGIGVLTYLLLRKVRKGNVEAIDISPDSIAYAKRYLSKSNVRLTAGNVLDYEAVNPPFDFILLFDVLEHIPIESHELLLSKIAGWMHDDSLLLINLPNADYILYDQKNNPETLQELDQPIYKEHIALVLSKASLDLQYLETYSIWVKNDYHFLIVQKKKAFQEILINNERNIFEKAIYRLKRETRKCLYNYPVTKKQAILKP